MSEDGEHAALVTESLHGLAGLGVEAGVEELDSNFSGEAAAGVHLGEVDLAEAALAEQIAEAELTVAGFWQFLRGSQFEETYRFAGESETGTISLNLARANGNGWVLLFDPGIAHAFVRVIALLYLTAPRMLGLALMLHHKAERLKRMDVPLCTRIIGRLVRAQGRVSFEDLARDFPEADLAQMIQPLTDVDGVVFLDKKGPGMTLAPRFLEDFNEWTTRNSQAAEDFE